LKEVDDCVAAIRDFTIEFGQKYGDLQNLKKFNDKFIR